MIRDPRQTMPTLDEMKEQQELFKIPDSKPGGGILRPAARPTYTLADNGETCRTCKFAIGRSMSKTYYKCAKNYARWTCGAATDIRLRDPACGMYEKGPCEHESVTPYKGPDTPADWPYAKCNDCRGTVRKNKETGRYE